MIKVNPIATIGIFFHLIFGTKPDCAVSGIHSLQSLKILSDSTLRSGKVSSEVSCNCRIQKSYVSKEFVLGLTTDQAVTSVSTVSTNFKLRSKKMAKYFEFENVYSINSPVNVTISLTLEHSASLLTGTCCCPTIETTEAITKASTEITSIAPATTKPTTKATELTGEYATNQATTKAPDTSTTEMDATHTSEFSAKATHDASITTTQTSDETQKSQAVTVTSETTMVFNPTTNSYIDSKNQTNTCQCICKNLTKEEALKKVEKVISEITVKKQDTKLAKSKKICAEDKRMSSKAIGVCGIIVLSVVFGSIVLIDVLTLCISKH